MELINIVKIENKKYVMADDLATHAPLYTKGMRSGKDLVKRKNIKDKWWAYAREVDGIWKKSDGKSRKYDKVFIREKYVKAKIKELSGESIAINGVKEAPPTVYLEYEEKFQDDEGNVLEIETRGERNPENCYFKVKDVMKGFDMKRLQDNILDKNTRYIKDEDYVYFYCTHPQKLGNKTNKKIRKELFLTYQGMMHVLFASHSKKANKFIKWATKTLFIAQMGTEEQKIELSSKLMGVEAGSMKETFNANARHIPCIYLFTLGKATDLRKSMKINKDYDDEMIVCKYGYTKNIKKRTNDHMKTYGKIKGSKLRLKVYSYIDPQYASKAEVNIKHVLKQVGNKLEYEKFDELVILDKNDMKFVLEQYKMMGKSYMGHLSEIIAEKKELEHRLELQRLEYEGKLKDKDNEILKIKLACAEKMLAVGMK